MELLRREVLLSPRLKAITTGNGTIECLDLDYDFEGLVFVLLGGSLA